MASNPNEANEPQIESTADEIKVNDYCFLLQEEDKAGFSANDLVWGKIKSHPWWPGQIFDPKYASEMALKCRKKDHFLVAYFGNMIFAWVPESQLKPFQSHFSEMEEQSATASFTSAVGAILEEVSKRVELGLACRCSAAGGFDKLLECRKVENAGVREGTCIVVDKFTVANAFRPESLLRYVWALAQCPSRGFVRLELTVAVAQLKAFYRSKGHSQLPRFASYTGLVENEAEISHLKSTRQRGRPRKNHGDGSEQKRPPNKMEEEEDADIGRSENDGVDLKALYRSKGHSQLPRFASYTGLVENEAEISHLKSTRPRGRPRKNHGDGSEQKRPPNKMEEEEDADIGRSENDGVGEEVDLKTRTRSSTRTRTRSVKLGDHISQAANWLNEESPLILKSIDDTPENSVTKRSRRNGADHLSTAEKENEVAIKEYSSSSEMLSQLYLVARDPMKGYNFLPMIQGFFTDFRVLYFSNSSDDQEPVKSAGRKRGRKKKVVKCEPASLEMSDPDFRFSQSYNSSEDQEPVKSAGRKRGRKKKVVNCDPASIEMSDPDFRLSPSSDSSEVQMPVKSMGRRSDRKKKVVNFEPDYIQDSYWSDIILQSSPEREPASKGQKRKRGSHKKGRAKKTKSAGESVLYDPKVPSMDTEQNNLLVEFSNPHEKQEVKEERIVEETPTALILSFNEYNSIPSATDLIKIFSSYGSVKEEETEVLRQTNRAKVVFKYRRDAENAFSIAGQLSVFGSTLVSYRLRYSPSPKSSPASSPLDMNYALPTKDGNLECQGQKGIGGAIDNV